MAVSSVLDVLFLIAGVLAYAAGHRASGAGLILVLCAYRDIALQLLK